MKDFKYYSYDELLPYVNSELEFLTVTGVKRGLLYKEKDKNFLWLPYLGGVKATSVPVKLFKN